MLLKNEGLHIKKSLEDFVLNKNEIESLATLDGIDNSSCYILGVKSRTIRIGEDLVNKEKGFLPRLRGIYLCESPLILSYAI